VVEVGDNGPEIHPEIEPYIFDPFFTTKGIGEATGLGLNTVRTIVRKHPGEVEAWRHRFQVWLPCADPSELGPLPGS
jgi:signal transduction histidine kinase